mgnify:CR=1 FL=1
MTREEVEQQLIAIAKDAHSDPEAAASRERRMHRDVLMHIASSGDGESVGLARAALRSWELFFRRIG